MSKKEKELVLSSVANKCCHHLVDIYKSKIKKKDIYLCRTCGKVIEQKKLSKKVKITEVRTPAQQLQFDGICKLFGTKI